MSVPEFCDAEAYELFRQQLASLNETASLVRAVEAIGRHALPDASPALVNDIFDHLAAQVRARVRSNEPRAIMAHLHAVLFDDLGFCGDDNDYYSPLNTYLPTVLERHRGLPIVLALIYKAVAERLGLKVSGVNSPGHFLVRVCDGSPSESALVDVFHGGMVLTPEEAVDLASRTCGRKPLPGEDFLPAASHKTWLRRILGNLMRYFAAHDFADDHAAMLELLTLLEAEVPGE